MTDAEYERIEAAADADHAVHLSHWFLSLALTRADEKKIPRPEPDEVTEPEPEAKTRRKAGRK